MGRTVHARHWAATATAAAVALCCCVASAERTERYWLGYASAAAAWAQLDDTAPDGPDGPQPGDVCPDCDGKGRVGDGRVFTDCLTCGSDGRIDEADVSEPPDRLLKPGSPPWPGSPPAPSAAGQEGGGLTDDDTVDAVAELQETFRQLSQPEPKRLTTADWEWWERHNLKPGDTYTSQTGKLMRLVKHPETGRPASQLVSPQRKEVPAAAPARVTQAPAVTTPPRPVVRRPAATVVRFVGVSPNTRSAWVRHVIEHGVPASVARSASMADLQRFHANCHAGLPWSANTIVRG